MKSSNHKLCSCYPTEMVADWISQCFHFRQRSRRASYSYSLSIIVFAQCSCSHKQQAITSYSSTNGSPHNKKWQGQSVVYKWWWCGRYVIITNKPVISLLILLVSMLFQLYYESITSEARGAYGLKQHHILNGFYAIGRQDCVSYDFVELRINWL